MKHKTVQIQTGFEGQAQAILDLFAQTFTDSEGPDEGALIADLVHDLITRTPQDEIYVFRAHDTDHLVGAVIFTALIYPDDPTKVFLLSPMAVATAQQGQGIGQTLIRSALATLRSEGVQVVLTYGDPNYYSRVGFTPIPETQARAPLPLSLPQGWIGQSLVEDAMPSLAGKPICVPALNRADIW